MDGFEVMAPAYVYMVRCGGGQLYTGWTNDPAARLHAHKTGQGARATRAFKAEHLAYLERCTDKPSALRITPSTLEEYEQWVEDTLARAPLILARDGSGRLLGYACAHRYHPREAFDWDVESTIYCAPDACSAGPPGLLERLCPSGRPQPCQRAVP